MSDRDELNDNIVESDPEWERFIRGRNEVLLVSGWIVLLHRYVAFDLQKREPSMHWEVRRLRERACGLGLTQISLEIEPELLIVQWYRHQPYDLCTNPPYWECQLPRVRAALGTRGREDPNDAPRVVARHVE